MRENFGTFARSGLDLMGKDGDRANENGQGMQCLTLCKGREPAATFGIGTKPAYTVPSLVVERALVNRSHKTGFSGETLEGGEWQPLRTKRRWWFATGLAPLHARSAVVWERTNQILGYASGPLGSVGWVAK